MVFFHYASRRGTRRNITCHCGVHTFLYNAFVNGTLYSNNNCKYNHSSCRGRGVKGCRLVLMVTRTTFIYRIYYTNIFRILCTAVSCSTFLYFYNFFSFLWWQPLHFSNCSLIKKYFYLFFWFFSFSIQSIV